MGVTFQNLAIGLKSDVVERIGQLAEAAAGARHQAALLEHSPRGVAPPADWPSDLAPETENRFSGYDQAVQRAARHAQVLDLAELQQLLGGIGIGPQRGNPFGNHLTEVEVGSPVQSWRRR